MQTQTLTTAPAAAGRRTALGFSLAALAAGLTVPALAAGPNPDLELIGLCDRLVDIEREEWLLTEYDEYAPEIGPNNARYKQLGVERRGLDDLIEGYPSPPTPAGITAIARVALVHVDRDSDGEVVCAHYGEQLLVKLAESVAPGFVWPPRPGNCPMTHWAPPNSPREIKEHHAAQQARMASIDAKIEADREAERAEQRRRDTPSLLTDDELRGRVKASRDLRGVANQIGAELDAELARRGLA